MARRKLGPKRSTQILFDLNKIEHDLRMEIVQVGTDIVGELAKRIAEEARSLAPVLPASETPSGPNKRGGDNKSGPIKQNIFAQASAKVPNSWIVCSPSWYSHFVEYGTEPHEIPRGVWQGSHTMVFPDRRGGNGLIHAKWVHHPGAKPKPFLRPAADKAEQFLNEIIQSRKS